MSSDAQAVWDGVTTPEAAKTEKVFAAPEVASDSQNGGSLLNLAAIVGLPLAGAIAFGSTWFMLSPAAEQVSRSALTSLMVFNLIVAGGFGLLISARLWHVISQRRDNLAGSGTHLQLVGMFALVAVVPAFFAFLFAFTVMRSSLNDVFGDRIDSSIDTAVLLARGYIDSKSAEDITHLNQIEFDMRNDRLIGVSPEATPILFRQRLFEQAFGRNLAAIIILDADKRIIASAKRIEAPYALPSKSVFDDLDQADEEGKVSYGANNSETLDFLRGVRKSYALDGGYIIIYRDLTSNISDGLIGVRTVQEEWQSAKSQRQRLERVFLGGYIVMALIVLFSAIWAALRAATRIVEPIGRLMRMAQSVSGGDLAARVDVYKDDGELGALARSMNHMTAQLQTQRDDLIETNRQFDRRRRFTEAVLSGVSAGVIGVSPARKLTIANKSAEDLLQFDAARAVGSSVGEVVPEFSELVEEALEAANKEVAAQLEVERDGGVKTFNVRVVSDNNTEGRGCVATFDDVTELIVAHRSAAWGDVARRIAHEIKNPLTPIQLSAERLRRKYRDEVTSAPDVFDRCTETIVRHVSDIRRMVDEFSSFARMPEPVIGPENIVEIIKSATFTQRVAFPDVEFSLKSPDNAPSVDCDDRLIVQALGNLMKNACESIDARLVSVPEPVGKVEIAIEDIGDDVRLTVTDNGIGFPKAARHRLTEPYMTTRAKGTGLGLAIVKKVIEEHGGSLSFDDARTLGPTGARVIVRLPKKNENQSEPKEGQRPSLDRPLDRTAQAAE